MEDQRPAPDFALIQRAFVDVQPESGFICGGGSVCWENCGTWPEAAHSKEDLLLEEVGTAPVTEL